MLYYIMHITFAAPLLAKFPKAALRDNDTLVVTGEMPKGFKGEVVPIYEMELSMTDLAVLVDKLRTETPHTGKLAITNSVQHNWLRDNHEAFKIEKIEEEP